MFRRWLLCLVLMLGGTVHPEEESQENGPVPVEAGSMILMDTGSGTVLLEKNASGHYDPAGLTKMMGAYIAAEVLKPDQMVIMTEEAFSTYDHSSGVLWIDKGEVIEAQSLIYASVLQSANDTMAMLAESVSGNQEAFVDLMNRTAGTMGLDDTQYRNIFGWNDEHHYSSAGDIAVLLRKALDNELFRTVFRTERWSIAPTAKQPSTRTVVSDCGLFGYEGEVGCEVGNSSYSGWSIAAEVTRGDTSFIVVLMGEESQEQMYADVRKVLDYGFSHYRTVTIHHEDIEPKTISIKRMGLNTAEVVLRCDQDFSVLMSTDREEAVLTAKIEAENTRTDDPEKVTGKVVFLLNGEKVAEVPAVREIKYPEGAYSSKGRQYFDYFSIMVLGGLILKFFLKYLSADHGA